MNLLNHVEALSSLSLSLSLCSPVSVNSFDISLLIHYQC